MSPPMVWVSLMHKPKDKNGRHEPAHVSSLLVLPDSLRVVGVLPHGAEVSIPLKEDRDKVHAWLDMQEVAT